MYSEMFSFCYLYSAGDPVVTELSLQLEGWSLNPVPPDKNIREFM